MEESIIVANSTPVVQELEPSQPASTEVSQAQPEVHQQNHENPAEDIEERKSAKASPKHGGKDGAPDQEEVSSLLDPQPAKDSTYTMPDLEEKKETLNISPVHHDLMKGEDDTRKSSMTGDMSDEALGSNKALVKSEEVEQEGEAHKSKEEVPESGFEERKEGEASADTAAKEGSETHGNIDNNLPVIESTTKPMTQPIAATKSSIHKDENDSNWETVDSKYEDVDS